jgi:hypothetical protein
MGKKQGLKSVFPKPQLEAKHVFGPGVCIKRFDREWLLMIGTAAGS